MGADGARKRKIAVIAALAAEGESRVENVELIDRGYEALDEALNALGADIRRI